MSLGTAYPDCFSSSAASHVVREEMKWERNREVQLAVAACVVSQESSSGCCHGVQQFYSETNEPGPSARCRMGR